MALLALLRSKNRCLEKFLLISAEFVSAHPTGVAEPEAIVQIQQERDRLLEVMSLYDRHITQEVAKLDSADRNAELKSGVETELKLREELVASILRADVALMSLIENSKNRLLREMAGEQKSKDTLSRFKSQRGGNSGSGIDERL